jgi:hypothetical protein
VIIEVLLALIRHPAEGQAGISARVRRHGITHQQVAQIFTHYELGKKNRASKRLPP